MKKFLFLLLFFPMQVLAADAMPMAEMIFPRRADSGLLISLNPMIKLMADRI